MKMDIEYIEWGDACDCQETWVSKKKAIKWAKSMPYKMKQVGFIVKETKKYILLASTDGDTLLSGVTIIPKGWIRKRINLTKHIK